MTPITFLVLDDFENTDSTGRMSVYCAGMKYTARDQELLDAVVKWVDEKKVEIIEPGKSDEPLAASPSEISGQGTVT